MGKGSPYSVRASFLLQSLSYLGDYYFYAFFFLETLIFVYKGLNFTYGFGILASDVCIFLLYSICELSRSFLTKKGNLAERIGTIVTALVMLIAPCLALVFMMLWQTYVLRIEFLLCSVQQAIYAIQLLFSIVAIVSFALAPAY